MEKEFVPYELALELKQLGFDGESFGRFYTKPKCKMFGIDEKGRTYPMKNTPKKLYTIGEHCVLTEDNVIIAPLYQQAFRWFREKYYLNYEISYAGRKGEYHAFVNQYVYGNNGNSPSIFTYEEAESDCLQKLIEIVLNKH